MLVSAVFWGNGQWDVWRTEFGRLARCYAYEFILVCVALGEYLTRGGDGASSVYSGAGLQHRLREDFRGSRTPQRR